MSNADHSDRASSEEQGQAASGILKQGATLLFQAGKDFFHDSGPQWAAAIAYYGLLSAFPMLLGAASLAAFFVDPGWAVERATSLLGDLIPRGAGQIEQIIKDAIDARESVGLLSIGALLWSGTRVFGVITKALNITYDVDEMYGFVKRTLMELLMLLSIGTLFVLALASRFVLRLLWDRLQFLPGREGPLFQVLLEIIPGLLLLITFFLAYRFVPRRKVSWKSALAGAGVAAVLVLVARPIFIQYIQRFANYNLIYGPLAVVIVLVLWAWLMAVFLLFGGEIVSHIQDMLIEGKSPQEVEQNHLRRSPYKGNNQ